MPLGTNGSEIEIVEKIPFMLLVEAFLGFFSRIAV